MSFDGGAFGTFAAALERSDLEPEQARVRSCISRYYYSALLQARDALRRTVGFTDAGHSTTHTAVIGAYRGMGIAEARSLADDLRQLRDLRNQADYGEDIERMPEQVKLARRWAGSVATKVRTVESRHR
jgi:uncharacterized protein (UPF0332 family)